MRSWSDLARGLVVAMAVAGCGGLEPVDPYQPITDPARLYQRLTLDHRAVNLALAEPYDTLQLTATPRNAAGAPMDGLPAPTFRSADTTLVWVSPEGLLQARQPALGVAVIAELAIEGNLRHADTAYVNVAATAPPTPDSLTIDPVPPDSAVWGMLPLNALAGRVLFAIGPQIAFDPVLAPRVLDPSGTPIPDLIFEYESLDPSTVRVERWFGTVAVLRPGQAAIVVRSTVNGVALADTVIFKTTLPVINGFQIQGAPGERSAFSPTEVTIRRNGYVFWTNLSWDSVEVTFDDPTHVLEIPQLCATLGGDFCLGGDIGRIEGSTNDFLLNTRGRRFPVPGTYIFRSTRTGNTGRVIVLDD